MPCDFAEGPLNKPPEVSARGDSTDFGIERMASLGCFKDKVSRKGSFEASFKGSLRGLCEHPQP